MSRLAHINDRSPRWAKNVANTVTRRYALTTSSRRTAPDFLVIGVKRGGTTSMFNYLMMHPGILGLFPQARGRKSSDYFFKNLSKGPDWYRSHFPTTAARSRLQSRLGYVPAAGEVSPYYLWDPRIAGLAHEMNPHLRAVALVRNPTERAWSHFQERRSNSVEPLSFDQAIAAEDDRLAGELDKMLADPTYYSTAHDWYSYRSRGVYLPQLENWASVFGRDQLLVLRSEDLYADVQGAFDRVCAFLGLPSHPLPTTRTFGAGKQRSSIPDAARRELDAFFAPHNRALGAYLDRDMGWSS